MFELRSVRPVSDSSSTHHRLVRSLGLAILLLALAAGLASPAAVLAAPGAGGGGPAVGSGPDGGSDGGPVVTATGDGDEEEDVDEWEGDILKSVSGPTPGGLLDGLGAALGRLLGFGADPGR
ncbi:MAG: hypothetical protein PVG07_03365 [Acidobacteriota bacterium]|jgi:hypothetical protein